MTSDEVRQSTAAATAGWEAFAVGDDRAGDDLRDSDDCLIPESGWGALLCWLAGPARVVRVPATRVRHEPVRVERLTRRGATAVEHVERTPADQQLIDDAVDEYLLDAGLPRRPRGYAWVLNQDTAGPWRDVGELSNALQQAVEDAGSPSEPVRVLAAGRTAFKA